MRPQNGLDTSLIRANTETTAPTSRWLTSKLRAKTGSTGTSTPKPTATQNAIRPSTMTSRGRVLRRRSHADGAFAQVTDLFCLITRLFRERGCDGAGLRWARVRE